LLIRELYHVFKFLGIYKGLPVTSWTAPSPVVQFIVRAVDNILKTEFDIREGLADHSKLKDAVDFHRVQILDPAAGTGTFLAEVIEKIYSHFANNKGAWQGYCTDHLIPRINGFEILMASYAMAHFKLDMKLKETGYTGEGTSRLKVYLTNSLEEPPRKCLNSLWKNG
jgi:predicted helicase